MFCFVKATDQAPTKILILKWRTTVKATFSHLKPGIVKYLTFLFLRNTQIINNFSKNSSCLFAFN